MERCIKSTLCEVKLANETSQRGNSNIYLDSGRTTLLYLNLILTAIISFGGIMGNSAIIIAFFKKKSLQSVNNIFLVQLAIVDCTKAVFILTVKVGTNLDLLRADDGLTPACYDLGYYCEVSGFISTITFVHSALLLAAIAVVRYVKMVRSSSFGKIFTRRNMIGCCCLLAILTLTLASLPVLKIGRYKYSPYHGVCFANWSKKNKPFRVLFYIYTIGICYVVILFSYISIYFKLRKHKKNTQESLDKTRAQVMSQSLQTLQSKLKYCNPSTGKEGTYKIKDPTCVETSAASVNCSNEVARELDDVRVSVTETKDDTVSLGNEIEPPSSEQVSLKDDDPHPVINEKEPEKGTSDCMSKVTARMRNKAQRDSQTYKSSRSFRNELKVTKVMFSIVIAYSVCWLPAFATNVIMFSTQKPGCEGNSSEIGPIALFFIITIVDLKVFLNPIIYGVLNAQFRKEIKNIVSNLLC